MTRLHGVLIGGIALAASLAVTFLPPVFAGPFGGAIGGAIRGGIAGRILGGEVGAIRGRRLGAAVGFVRGAADASRRRSQERDSRRRYENSRRKAKKQREARTKQLESQRRAAATPKADETVRLIQAHLIVMGQNPGKVDGVMSSATAAAIRAYQKKHGLLATGKPSPELLKHMQAKKK